MRRRGAWQPELVRAAERSRRLYPRSVGYQRAYFRGAQAALAGKPETACPYRREVASTWRTAWRRAWMGGYDSIRGDE